MPMLDPRKFPFQVVKRVPSAFDNADWLFEIKHDGFRVTHETAMTSAVAIST
jgi:hypothetical protein